MAPRVRTTPRKKAAQERSKATVEALLTATARVLVRDGYDRASTNRIAEEAGVSVGSLYQYFPSKEALVAALIDRHCEEMTAVLDRSFAEVADAPVHVATRLLVRGQIEAHKVDWQLHRVLIEQVPRVGRLDRMTVVDEHAQTLVRAYLELHRDEVRVKDLDRLAFMAVHVVEGLTHAAAQRQPEMLEDERLVDEIVELLVRYAVVETPAARAPRVRRAQPA